MAERVSTSRSYQEREILAKISNKEEAIRYIIDNYPGESCDEVDTWVLYNDVTQDLIEMFSISSADIRLAECDNDKSEEGGTKYD